MADDETLAYVEAEREHFAQVARDTFAELRAVTAERDGYCDRLAQVTARAERAEADLREALVAAVTAQRDRDVARAQVERVRGLAPAWEAWERDPDAGDYADGCHDQAERCAADLRAALAETADSDSEPYVPPQSAEQGEVAPGGRDDSAGLSEATRLIERLAGMSCDPRCTLGPNADHPGTTAYRCVDEHGHAIPFDDTDDMEDLR